MTQPDRPSGIVNTAGWAAQAAVMTLIVSFVALMLFFGGGGAIFGPINDVFISITLILLVPAVLVVGALAREHVGGWFRLLTAVTLGGLALAALGQLMLVFGVIDLQMSFVTFGAGLLPLLFWIGALSAVSLGGQPRQIVAPAVGWWGVAFMLALLATLIAFQFLPQIVLYAAGLALAVSLAAWMWTLGADLRRRATEPSIEP